MTIKRSLPVRVDLLGGTLDLAPINLIVPNACTLNMAISQLTQVQLTATDYDGVKVISRDYDLTKKIPASDFTAQNLGSDYFAQLRFVALLLDFFGMRSKIEVDLQSGSPAGAGLGGSSTMGVTLYSALCEFVGREFNREKCITTVKGIESIILNAGPTGYQDYYPALYGGVLALHPSVEGVLVEQLLNPTLKNFIEEHITLVFSGQSRNSGVNNWEVYKGFFDQNSEIQQGLNRIAQLSHQALAAIKQGNLQNFLELLKEEGECRTGLFPDIATAPMQQLLSILRQEVDQDIGLKVCGAGGGGCFLIIHRPEDISRVQSTIEKKSMKKLDFTIHPSIEGE